MNLKELFESFNNGRKIITSRINNYEMYKNFNDELLENLLTNHPTKSISNIEYLIIKPHKIFKTKTLYYKQPNKQEDNVSYKLCIQNIFGQYSTEKNTKTNKISSFRNSISNTKRKVFQSNLKNNCCEQCDEYCDKPHIDHYKISFKQIFEQFLNLKKIKIEEVDTFYSSCLHHITDKTLKKDFIDYHDGLVTYKLLCPKCNTSNGTYGY